MRVFLTLSLLFGLACGTAEDPNAEILAAVERHLSKRTDLEMSSMDLSVDRVEINGDQAEAEIGFTARGNTEAAMSMTYSLRKTADGWEVEPKPSAGHGMPAPQTPPAGTMPPNHPPTGGGEQPQPLPQGHPPIAQ